MAGSPKSAALIDAAAAKLLARGMPSGRRAFPEELVYAGQRLDSLSPSLLADASLPDSAKVQYLYLRQVLRANPLGAVSCPSVQETARALGRPQRTVQNDRKHLRIARWIMSVRQVHDSKGKCVGQVLALFDTPAPLLSALELDSEYRALVEEGASGKLNVAARHAAVGILEVIKTREHDQSHLDLSRSITATTNHPAPLDRPKTEFNRSVYSPPPIAGANVRESQVTTAPQISVPIPSDGADLRWPMGWDQTTRLRLARIVGGGVPPLTPSQQQEVIDALVTRQNSRTKPPLNDMGAYTLELCQRQRNGTFNPPVPGAPVGVSTPDPIRERERREREVHGEIRALESMAQESARRHGQDNVTTAALREQIVKLRAELAGR